MSENPKTTILNDAEGRITVTTGEMVTVFATSQRYPTVGTSRAAEQIALLQREVLRLRKQLASVASEAEEEVAWLEKRVEELSQ
jgi:hypothetical protein